MVFQHELGSHPAKPKRRAAACDFCRHKKARCSNGQDISSGKCTNCLVYDVSCTYTEASKKSPSRGYVESLERRLANLEVMVKKISPDLDLNTIIGNLTTIGKNQDDDMNVSSPAQSQESQNFAFPMVAPNFVSDDEAESTSEDEREASDKITRTKLVADGLQIPLFTGKSSFYAFSRDAVQAKREMTGHIDVTEDLIPTTRNFGRPEFSVHQWMIPTFRPPEEHYVFPEEDLLDSLVDLYFSHLNIFYPLLHRPTFDKRRAEGLHIVDNGFGATVLLVCAIGCRFSDDPRVSNNVTTESSSTAWFLFNQVGRLGLSWYSPQSLYDLQVYPLAALFLEGAASPQSGWILVGSGLRFVLDVGAHRRRLYGTEPSAEGELWKRAFWVLLVLDRLTGSMLGRPCALQDADFDVELPIECDDEYWDHPDPAKNFKQPPGKPSRMTFFIWFIKLNQILAFALRTIYSIKKSRVVLGYGGDQWEPRIVAELDSALNRWEAALPEFLRWNMKEEDVLLFRQTVVLYCRYYELQMIIHRPFVRTRRQTVMSKTSFSICLQAARSCCHMAHDTLDRSGPARTQCVLPVFVSCVMFIVKGWSGKRFGSTDSREIEDANKCLQFLLLCKDRWMMAGKLINMINAVIHYKGPMSSDSLRHHVFSSPVVHVPFESPTSSNKGSPPEDRKGSPASPAQSRSGDSSDMDLGPDDMYHLPLHLEQYFFAEMDQASFNNPTSSTANTYLFTEPAPATDKQPGPEETTMFDDFLTGKEEGGQSWNANWSDQFSAPRVNQRAQNSQTGKGSQQAQIDPNKALLGFESTFDYFQS